MAIHSLRIENLCAAFEEGVQEKDKNKAADMLWAAWGDLWKLLGEEGIRSAEVAEEKINWQFGNWANDTDEALDRAKRYADEIELCRNILEIEWDDEIFHENARRSIADCHASLGEMAKARDLYEMYLKDDPRWGWGWIGYLRLLDESGDERLMDELDAMRLRLEADRAIRDAEDVYDALGNLYADHEEMEKSDRSFEACRALVDAKPRFFDYPTGGKKTPATVQPGVVKAAKVGRNEPCPCGSGKKYKKCCGKSTP